MRTSIAPEVAPFQRRLLLLAVPFSNLIDAFPLVKVMSVTEYSEPPEASVNCSGAIAGVKPMGSVKSNFVSVALTESAATKATKESKNFFIII